MEPKIFFSSWRLWTQDLLIFQCFSSPPASTQTNPCIRRSYVRLFHLGLECLTNLSFPEEGILQAVILKWKPPDQGICPPLPVTDPCSQWETQNHVLQASLSRILISALRPAQHSKQGSSKWALHSLAGARAPISMPVLVSGHNSVVH